MSRKMKTMDGNNAAAYVSYAFTDVAAIYPITPSSVMADDIDKYATSGKKNLFGKEVQITEMQSEAGAAGAVHGSLAAGALTTTYTASQGLLLMIPNMYKMAGELLPSVIHVSARTLATHALSIFGDHSDIYACRQVGYAMICSNSPQEVMDLSAIAHLSAIKGRVPFLHFFDGFRTSHEIQKIETWNYDDLGNMLDFEALEKFRRRALNPEHPVTRGTAQNDDIFFQARESCNLYYDKIPKIVNDYMNEVNQKIGTNYKPFNYYGDPNAERIIIAMGSVCETIEEVVDYLNFAGEKVGLIKVRLYRPFIKEYLLNVIPKTVKIISVLDRTKELGSIGEPLYLDILASLFGTDFANINVLSGRYGLSSKDTNPEQIIAVYKNMSLPERKKRFTIGIKDDITFLSLPINESPDTTPEGTSSCKFFGLGADGTVGANKNSIKIIGDHTNMYAQGYFSYDSKKSGGLTISHLRFGNKPIKSTYYVNKSDFVACHNPSYVYKYDMVSDIKEGGKFLLNCSWDLKELDQNLPNYMKKIIAENKINLYIIDGIKIGKEIGLGGKINTILQSAFFKITNIIKEDQAVKYMKDAATKLYIKKGEQIVKMNHKAIEYGMSDVIKIDIPESWKNISDIPKDKDIDQVDNKEGILNKYVNNILKPVNSYEGNKLPVSAFIDHVDGTVPPGSAAYEKRGIAREVPSWNFENCIQCTFCSYVCPHAVIRPAILTDKEISNAPNQIIYKKATGIPQMNFAITISTLDCTGCGACAQVCPGMKGEKALKMKPIDSQLKYQEVFDYAKKLEPKKEVNDKFKESTIKGSQLKQPLLEFSGACAGCGETPYAKLATQLFGDRMIIANATGCSSIWGGSAPATPYTLNQKGEGPAWQNSLFEDNAEFGYGIALGQKAIRSKLIENVEKILRETKNQELKLACEKYISTINNGAINKSDVENLIEKLKSNNNDNSKINEISKEILKNKDYLSKKSIWMFGGDGWAYDIGFGGLDHVIASGEDINILVFDTEVYSNTGGQSSKATPMGSVAQFASSGKTTKKKDLAAIAMSYGYVYVAQVAMGSNYNQCLKAFIEAENYNGPSIIIAYSPCINHGIKGGMSIAQLEQKKAVLSGYWNLFRFDPRLKIEEKNPFILDSKAPSESYQNFIMGEIRYNSLIREFPQRANELFNQAEKQSHDKYKYLEFLSESGNKKG